MSETGLCGEDQCDTILFDQYRSEDKNATMNSVQDSVSLQCGERANERGKKGGNSKSPKASSVAESLLDPCKHFDIL